MSKHLPITSLILKQNYTFGSLNNAADGVRFSIKNRISNAQVTDLLYVSIDGKDIPKSAIGLDLGNGQVVSAQTVSPEHPVDFPLGKSLDTVIEMEALSNGLHEIAIAVATEPFGKLAFTVEDAISAPYEGVRIPRNPADDYSLEAITQRQEFVEILTGTKLQHVSQYSFDPHMIIGNCEHFTGVTQVPLGLAGPLKVNGEHAQGEFLIPLATTEGTLVASYNRGMKVLNLCGGAKATVVGDAMQRAPVFVFWDAREARDFVAWVQAHLAEISQEAEATSRVAKLLYIDPYLSNKFAFLRFNFSTGDAAGQNMVGRATFAACSWILDNYGQHKVRNFYLESNFATDKKASHVNMMHTRGKRVTAEAVLTHDVLTQHMRVNPRSLAYHGQVSNVGSFLSGANNNGLHAANAITAMFIATGQDVANVAESSAGIIYTELTPNDDLYISITLPSLIVATYGGGTGLATQSECLELLGCRGRGTVNKLAEIVAAVVLAGEISLASAISSLDWVSSHEAYGRNR